MLQVHGALGGCLYIYFSPSCTTLNLFLVTKYKYNSPISLTNIKLHPSHILLTNFLIHHGTKHLLTYYLIILHNIRYMTLSKRYIQLRSSYQSDIPIYLSPTTLHLFSLLLKFSMNTMVLITS